MVGGRRSIHSRRVPSLRLSWADCLPPRAPRRRLKRLEAVRGGVGFPLAPRDNSRGPGRKVKRGASHSVGGSFRYAPLTPLLRAARALLLSCNLRNSVVCRQRFIRGGFLREGYPQKPPPNPPGAPQGRHAVAMRSQCHAGRGTDSSRKGSSVTPAVARIQAERVAVSCRPWHGFKPKG